MVNELIPVALASSIVKLDHELEDWNLDDGGEVESEPRTFIHRVNFEAPFGSAPVVQVGLTGFDIDQRNSARITVEPQKIDATGFDIAVSTWNDTRVYGVDVSWIAIGS